MTGLPRGRDTTSPRSVFGLFMLDGLERITTALRRGDPFSQDALDDMLALSRRHRAFCAALEDRMKQHGMDDVLEDIE